jgi:hypothetical protein
MLACWQNSQLGWFWLAINNLNILIILILFILILLSFKINK